MPTPLPADSAAASAPSSLPLKAPPPRPVPSRPSTAPPPPPLPRPRPAPSRSGPTSPSKPNSTNKRYPGRKSHFFLPGDHVRRLRHPNRPTHQDLSRIPQWPRGPGGAGRLPPGGTGFHLRTARPQWRGQNHVRQNAAVRRPSDLRNSPRFRPPGAPTGSPPPDRLSPRKPPLSHLFHRRGHARFLWGAFRPVANGPQPADPRITRTDRSRGLGRCPHRQVLQRNAATRRFGAGAPPLPFPADSRRAFGRRRSRRPPPDPRHSAHPRTARRHHLPQF